MCIDVSVRRKRKQEREEEEGGGKDILTEVLLSYLSYNPTSSKATV